ncbi:helix-turn-helix domain-containing protein [Paenibacillus sp. CC-CFT747]|nr:helix-turn-helix domain-containing protein [Paenibacillus sp. CC-CFT747]
MGIRLSGDTYAVAVLQFQEPDKDSGRDRYEKLGMESLITTETMRGMLNGTGHVHQLDERHMAVLFALPGRELSACKDRLSFFVVRLLVELNKTFSIHPVVGIGQFAESLMEAARSREEAMQALTYYAWNPSSPVIWFEQVPKSNDSFSYPAETELRLMNLVKAGGEEPLKELLRELYEENFRGRKLAQPMLRLFVYELWSTTVKIRDQIAAVEEADGFEFIQFDRIEASVQQDLKGSYSHLEDTLGRMAAAVNKRKKSGNNELIQLILEHIQQAYVQPDLSLAGISDRFELSEAYLSRFFKEQTGVTFSDYLESLRMQKAKELLCEGDMPVSDIVQAIGYHSANTFGRAFKRVHGISATAYRSSFRA